MTVSRGHKGFILVMVLVITAVGLLFGAGALLLFRYQCQLRIDRQHELEKVFAVRSALNYVRWTETSIGEEGKKFGYHTWSGRDLGLLVKPVNPIFPKESDPSHLILQKSVSGDRSFNKSKRFSDTPDYEYGAEGVGDESGILVGNVSTNGFYGLAFNDVNATNTVVNGVTNSPRWWVNVGMKGTGGWLQEEYGRRYLFQPLSYIDGFSVKDTIRLCLIRNVTNSTQEVGRQHGWPLSMPGEMALVFEITPGAGNSTNNAHMSISEHQYGRAPTIILAKDHCPSLCYMGLQLADNKVTMFYIANDGPGNEKMRGYTFLGTREVAKDSGFYKYFAHPVILNGVPYDGVITNQVTHRLEAPEMRAVFEVIGTSDKRQEDTLLDLDSQDFVTDFRVTPAYQFDVYLDNRNSKIQQATVAQVIGVHARPGEGDGYTIVTYDTLGTDHKGFRYDEKHARENQ